MLFSKVMAFHCCQGRLYCIRKRFIVNMQNRFRGARATTVGNLKA
jgi:hypothetical protein